MLCGVDRVARPCQRCIKRGLQDSCQDGIRKKAKYLQDAIDGMDLEYEASDFSGGAET